MKDKCAWSKYLFLFLFLPFWLIANNAVLAEGGEPSYNWVLVEVRDYDRSADIAKFNIARKASYHIDVRYAQHSCYVKTTYTGGTKTTPPMINGEHLAVQVNWSAPPAKIADQQRVALTVNMSVVSNTLSYFTFSNSTRAAFDQENIKPGYASGGEVNFLNEKGTYHFEVGQKNGYQSINETVTAIPRSGSEKGDRMALNIRCSTMAAPIGTVYVYEWQPVGAGTSSTVAGAARTVASGSGAGSTESASGTDSMGSRGVGVAEPAAASQMTLQAGVRKVAAGQTVTVPVWLIQAAAANMNFNVEYDPAVVVSAGPVIKGNLLDKSLFEANTGERATLRVGFAQGKDLSGVGTVAQIPFKAVGKPGDRSVLRLKVLKSGTASAANAPVAVIHGEILIVGRDGQVPGDSDGDGVLTAGDALSALKMSVKLIPSKASLDMDKDRQVTSNDAMLILQNVVGK